MNQTSQIDDVEGQLPDEFRLIRAIIDAVPEPIFCKDRDWRFLLINRASCEIFEASADAFIGMTVFDIPGLRENAHLYHADDMRVVNTGKPVVNREEPFDRPDGKRGCFLTDRKSVV